MILKQSCWQWRPRCCRSASLKSPQISPRSSGKQIHRFGAESAPWILTAEENPVCSAPKKVFLRHRFSIVRCVRKHNGCCHQVRMNTGDISLAQNLDLPVIEHCTGCRNKRVQEICEPIISATIFRQELLHTASRGRFALLAVGKKPIVCPRDEFQTKPTNLTNEFKSSQPDFLPTQEQQRTQPTNQAIQVNNFLLFSSIGFFTSVFTLRSRSLHTKPVITHQTLVQQYQARFSYPFSA